MPTASRKQQGSRVTASSGAAVVVVDGAVKMGAGPALTEVNPAAKAASQMTRAAIVPDASSRAVSRRASSVQP